MSLLFDVDVLVWYINLRWGSGWDYFKDCHLTVSMDKKTIHMKDISGFIMLKAASCECHISFVPDSEVD